MNSYKIYFSLFCIKKREQKCSRLKKATYKHSFLFAFGVKLNLSKNS